MKTHTYILLLLIALTGCKAQREIIYQHKNHYTHTHEQDTITITERDSIIIQRKNDTVFLEKIKYRWREREKTKTEYIQQTDTVFIHNEKSTPKTGSTFWQRVELFVYLALFILLFFVIFIHLHRSKQ